MSKFIVIRRKDWTKVKFFLYNVLDKTGTKSSYIYNIIVLLIIAGAVVMHVLATEIIFEKNVYFRFTFFLYDFFVLIFFGFEYVVRFFVCSANVKYCGIKGRLKYLTNIYTLIDTLVIISSAIIIISHYNVAFKEVVSYANYFQILRLVRIDRTKGHLETMWHAIYSHRKELLTCYVACIFVLLLGSYFIYLIERGSDTVEGRIDNMLIGLYWGVETFTTTGYGDYSPHTWYGKLVTSFLCMIGCAFFALPAGILGSGFALQVSKKKKEKGSIKVKNPAAILIQCAWRSYAVKNLNSKSTWKYVIMKIVAEKEKIKAAKLLKSQTIVVSNLNADEHINDVAKDVINRTAITKSSNLKALLKKDQIEKISSVNAFQQDSYYIEKNMQRMQSKNSSMRIVRTYTVVDHINSAGIIENSSLKIPRKNYQKERNKVTKKAPVAIDHVSSVGIIENASAKHKKLFHTKTIRQKSFKKKKSKNCFDELVNIFSIYSESEWLPSEIPFKYQLVYSFITLLKLTVAAKTFSVTRHPYVNLEHILQINNSSLSCSSSLLRELKGAICLIQSEMKDLQNEIRELKNLKYQREISDRNIEDNIM